MLEKKRRNGQLVFPAALLSAADTRVMRGASSSIHDPANFTAAKNTTTVSKYDCCRYVQV
jgi:hypothetical protein